MLPLPGGAFWAPPDPSTGPGEYVFDAAFIDNEALAVVASSPAGFDHKIEVLLDTVFSVSETSICKSTLHLEKLRHC